MSALRALADGPGVWLGACMVYLYLFWLVYVLVMAFYRASLSGRLVGAARWLAYPVVLLGIALDLVANWTLATLIFMELPTGPLELVTSRLSRYIKGPPGWRQLRAEWVCRSLLDVFDPTGLHCK